MKLTKCPHRVYIDSLPAIVETPELACGFCLSYESDDMWVRVVKTESGVASRRTLMRHLVLIETHKEPIIHFVICYHELRKRGLECCVPQLGIPRDYTFHNFIAYEKAQDRAANLGDELPYLV